MEILPTLEKAFPLPETLEALLDQLTVLRAHVDSFRPFNPAQLEKLQSAWDTEYTFESNRIEGNTLTLSETSLVIHDGITVGGKTLNEHLEAINHSEAVTYLREIVDSTEPMGESTIKQLHSLILKNTKHHDERGRYRSVPVFITGTTYVPPQPWQVQKLMEDLIVHFKEKQTHLHPVELAADVHAELVGVHPFIDGNGRTSRLVMNLLLLRAGYPIANISGEPALRKAYYDSLNKSHIDHDDTPFRVLVGQYVRKSLFSYLAMVSGNTDKPANDQQAAFYKAMLAV